MSSTSTTELSEKDKELYDRQIRVWGVEAQMRMQSCFVLVSGLHGVNCEVIKNLVLAGINVMIQDDRNIEMMDYGSNYFIGMNDVGKNLASSSLDNIKLLNNNTRVECEIRPLKNLDDEWFSQFDVILLSDRSTDEESVRINNICRYQKNICFFWSGTFALEGWYICDFGNDFKYKGDDSNSNNEKKTPHKNLDNEGNTSQSDDVMLLSDGRNTERASSEKIMSFPSLTDILGTPWNLLQTNQRRKSTSIPTKTYIQSRILAEYKQKKNGMPISEDDTEEFVRYSRKRLHENGLDESFLDRSKLDALCQGPNACLIVISSVLGGYLTQEIQKAVAHIGEPHFNVFEFTGDDQIGRCFKAGVQR